VLCVSAVRFVRVCAPAAPPAFLADQLAAPVCVAQNAQLFFDGRVLLSSLPIVQWNVTGGWLNGNVQVIPGNFFDVRSVPSSAQSFSSA
jgi:hypothetical protein